MSQQDLNRLQEKIAYLERVVDELSDVVTAQGRELDRAQAQLRRLVARDLEREAEGTGGVILGDERPPHY